MRRLRKQIKKESARVSKVSKGFMSIDLDCLQKNVEARGETRDRTETTTAILETNAERSLMPDSQRLAAKLHYKSFHQSMANSRELQRAGETFMREHAK